MMLVSCALAFVLTLSLVMSCQGLRMNHQARGLKDRLALGNSSAAEQGITLSLCDQWIIGPENQWEEGLRYFGSSVLELSGCGSGKRVGPDLLLEGQYFKIGAAGQAGYDEKGLKIKSHEPFNVTCYVEDVKKKGLTCEGHYTYVHNHWWDPFGMFSSEDKYIEFRMTTELEFQAREAVVKSGKYFFEEWQSATPENLASASFHHEQSAKMDAMSVQSAK
jgi:hypothetical protein